MDIPLLNEKYKERPVIGPEDFLKHLEEFRGRKRPKIPKYALFSFWPALYDWVKKKHKARESKFLSSRFPFLTFKYKDMNAVFMCLSIGAPMAGMQVDMMFALGTEYAIFFGAPGVLTSSIKRWEIIMPTKA
ncbi:MAG: hypothetical protein KAI64_02900, partial [Thermoplasmata archaeon]|nr:hypothetical protein [Thermoplasmata archaeon]